mmetsp:Transcript_37042/g.75561  ORF Transcript_37042/g.75561 Transcript_37042/m.75561 type:complete len:112 (-) Transcript_37042:12-347(-)
MVQQPMQIALLDICRILETNRIDRSNHPFAKKKKSFVVESCDDIFLFEAGSEKERNEIVHGLKLCVARLASCLIVGDGQVYDQFFTDGIMSVPGEAPCWIECKETVTDVVA